MRTFQPNAAQTGEKLQIFHAGQFAVQGQVGRDIPDDRRRCMASKFRAVHDDADGSRRGRQQAGDDFEQSAFACAVRAHDDADFAGLHLHGHAAQNAPHSEMVVYIFKTDADLRGRIGQSVFL